MAIKITLLGTGEAVDAHRKNTAYLIETPEISIQVDCGFNVLHGLCLAIGGSDALTSKPKMILLTHLHGDHTFSIPQELLAISEEIVKTGDKRKITIAGEPRAVSAAPSLVEAAYPGFMELFRKRGLDINLEPFKNKIQIGKLKITSAPTKHSVPNFAYRFDYDGCSFAISGDGALTGESKKIFEGVDILFHEGFFVSKESDNHASIKDVCEYAVSVGIKKVLIVHTNKDERKLTKEIKLYQKRAKDAGFELHMAEDGKTFFL